MIDIDDDDEEGDDGEIVAVSNSSLNHHSTDAKPTMSNRTHFKDDDDDDTILIFHGTHLDSDSIRNNELLGSDQQWIDYLEMLIRIGTKIGKNPKLSCCVERFCQFFNGYTFAKRCFTLKEPFIEKATTLKNLVCGFAPVGCLDEVVALVMERY